VPMSKLKKTSYWLLGLLLLSMVAASVAVSFLDWNKYRTTLADIASTQMGMRVELAGDVAVALFPRPSVSAARVRIAPLSDGFSEVVAQAEKISMHLGVRGFLAGNVAVQSLSLEGVSAAIEQRADGTWFVKGWPEQSDDTAAQMDISRLNLINGNLTLAPYQARPIAIEDISLALAGSLPAGPLEWTGNFSINNQTVQSSGKLRPVRIRNEIAVKADLHVGGGQVELSGRVAEDGEFMSRLLVSGNDLARFFGSMNILRGEEPASEQLPQAPFKFDVQVDKNAAITRIVSRELTLASTRGRLDLTLASVAGENHLTGSLALGVIDFSEWRRRESINGPSSITAEMREDSQPKKQFIDGGAIDLTIEGLRMPAGVGQRIDASLVLKDGIPAIERLQALLPGATVVSLRGNLAADTGQAKLEYQVGSVADLARWFDVDLSKINGAKRLATASGSGVLDYRHGVWAISEHEGLADATVVRGEMSGDFESLLPSHVKARLSRLNIGAPNVVSNPEVEILLPLDVDVSFDVRVDDLFGFQSNLGEARIVGSLNNGALDVEQLLLMQGNSSLRLEGRVENQPVGLNMQAGVDFANWTLPIVSSLLPGFGQYLIAANSEQLTGTASFAGPLHNMRLGFDAISGENEIQFNGQIGFANNVFQSVALQGGIKHNNLAGVSRLVGAGDYKRLPLQATYTLTKAADDNRIAAKMSGLLAGGNIQSEFNGADRIDSLSLTFDHDNVGSLSRLLGVPQRFLDSSAGLNTALSITRTPSGWVLDLDSFKNATRSVSGELSIGQENQVAGTILMSDVTFERLSTSRATDNGDSVNSFVGLVKPLSGTVNVSMENVTVSGQRLVAPNAVVAFEQGTINADLGEGAQVNGGAASASIAVSLLDTMPFTARLSAQKLDGAKLFTSYKVGAVLDAEGAMDIELAGALAGDMPFTNTLAGQGAFSGNAGYLGFLSVPELQRTLETASSGKGFLSQIGALLRSGQTPFTSMKSKFTLDSGVMLVEEAAAEGGWGRLVLDGQVNLADRLLNMKGELAMASPAGSPVIPVSYNGSFDAPNASWSSRLFERFVLAGIERRVRAGLFNEMEARQRESGQGTESPGSAVFSRALGLLGQLQAAQQQRKEAEEARRNAEEAAKAPAPSS
jgi:hypothetical protein